MPVNLTSTCHSCVPHVYQLTINQLNMSTNKTDFVEKPPFFTTRETAVVSFRDASIVMCIICSSSKSMRPEPEFISSPISSMFIDDPCSLGGGEGPGTCIYAYVACMCASATCCVSTSRARLWYVGQIIRPSGHCADM